MKAMNRYGISIATAGLVLLLVAFLGIPGAAPGTDDLLPSLNKAIEALQAEVKRAEAQLSRFKPPMMPGKPSRPGPRGARSKPPHAKPAVVKPSVKPSKIDLPVSVGKMQKMSVSLSRTISESRKKYRKAPSNRQLAGSLRSLDRALRELAKAKKRGDKAGAEKALREISSTLNSMKKQSKLLAADVKKLDAMKLKLKKSHDIGPYPQQYKLEKRPIPDLRGIPRVTQISPDDYVFAHNWDSPISVRFNWPLDQSTVTANTVIVEAYPNGNRTRVAGSVEVLSDRKTVTFRPSGRYPTGVGDTRVTITLIGTDKGSGAIKGSTGVLIDGDGDGKAGGDFVHEFNILG